MPGYLVSSLNISGKVNNTQRMKFGVPSDQNPSCPEKKGVSADVLRVMICKEGSSCFYYQRSICPYAHNVQELNKLLSSYKTEECTNWKDKGKCKYGIGCRFVHDEEEKRNCGDTVQYTEEDWDTLTACLAPSKNQANNGNKTDDINVSKLNPPPGFQLKAYSEVAKANALNDTGTTDKADEKENIGNSSTAFKESKYGTAISGFSEQGPLFNEDTTSQCESSNNDKNSTCVCNGKYHIKHKGCILPEHQVPLETIQKAVCRTRKWCESPYGKKCNYCHNPEELKKRFAKYKSHQCSAVKNNAECEDGDHCRYYHCEREKRKVDTIIADDILRKALGTKLRTNADASPLPTVDSTSPVDGGKEVRDASINDGPPDSVGNECSGSQDREGASVGSHTSANTPDRGPGSQVCFSCRGPDPLIRLFNGFWFHKTCYDDMNNVNANEKCFRCKEPDTHLTFRGQWFHLNCFNQMNELFAKK